MADASFFVKNLVQFLEALQYRFPENSGVQSALTKLRSVPSAFHGMVMDQWVKLTEPHAENIEHRNGAAVAAAFDSSEFDTLSSLKVGSILDNPEVDQQTVDTVWKYIDTLCHVAKMVNHTELPPPPTPEELERAAAASATGSATGSVTGSASTPAPATAPGATGASAKGTPDVEKIVESITSAMPKVIAGLNKALQTSSDGGENPVGDMLKQLMNPGRLQPGIANNLMANMMDTDASVMESVTAETGLSAAEIMQKLERLEKYERMRKRKQGKKH